MRPFVLGDPQLPVPSIGSLWVQYSQPQCRCDIVDGVTVSFSGKQVQVTNKRVNAVDVREGSSAGQQLFQAGVPLHDEFVQPGRAQSSACQYDLALLPCDEAFRQDAESLTLFGHFLTKAWD